VKRRSLAALIPLVFFACDSSRHAAAPARRQVDGLSYSEGWSGESQPVPTMVALASNGRVAAYDSAASSDAVRVASPDAANMVIRVATAWVKVDSLERAIAAVHDLAARVGGFVANAALQTGDGQLRSATIEVKIPATRFDEAFAGLKPIGKLESSNVVTQDVGEEFVDVTARMDNAHRLERRLIDLIATRTGKLKDVLDVEQELARVREEIERYQGRLRYLQAHTALSTLTVYVHEPVPVVGTAGTSVMGEAFRQAWRNFVTFLAVFVQALGIIIPLGAIAGAVWFVVRARERASSRAAA
jgi:hypothetical protein